MNKNFQDILNEKIGKHQSKKAESECHNYPPTQKPTELHWDLLQYLKKSVNINISLKTEYKLADTNFSEEKLNYRKEQNSIAQEDVGYFERSDAVIFALLFVKNLNLDIKDGISKKQLKRSFRKMLLKHHPDTSSSAMDTEQFTQMLEQFKILEKAWKPHNEAA